MAQVSLLIQDGSVIVNAHQNIKVPFDLLLLSIELFYYWRLQRMVAPARLTKLLSAMYLDGVSYFVATFSIKLGAAFVVRLQSHLKRI